MAFKQSFLWIVLCFAYLNFSFLYASDDPVHCSGTIINDQGNAVSDAHVFLYEMSYNTATSEIIRKVIQQTRSNEKGQFTLSTNRSNNPLQQWGTLVVASKEHGIRWVPWNLNKDQSIEFQMTQYGQIAGRVVDENGNPITAVAVRALLMLPGDNTDDINFFDRFVETTDEKGQFRFDYIPPDASADFYIETPSGASFCTAETGIVESSLRYQCGDKPIEIVLSDQLAMNNNVRSMTYGEMLVNSRMYQRYLKRFKPVEIAQPAFAEPQKQVISGMVIEAPFIPLAQVNMSFYDVIKDVSQPSGYKVELIGQTQTDVSGQYSFERDGYDRQVDHNLIVAYKKDYPLFVKSIAFSKENQLEPLMLEYGCKKYTGSVVDTDGNPVPGASVSAYVSSFVSHKDYAKPVEQEVAMTEWLTAITNEKGEFEISNIPLYAKAEFSIEAEGYSTQYTWVTDLPLKEMTVPVGGNPLLFTLEKTGAIEGQLLDANTNKAIPNEKIFIIKVDGSNQMGAVWSALSGSQVSKDLEGNNREVMTDQKGDFSANDLAPGTYIVSLDPFTSDKRKWHAKAQEIFVPESRTVEVLLTAVKLGSVSVKVQDTNKQPLEGANVMLRSLAAKKDQKRSEDKNQSEIYPVNRITFIPAGSSEEQVLFQTADPSDEIMLPVRTNKDGIAVFRVAPGDYMIQSVAKMDYIYTPSQQTITVQSGSNYNHVVNLQYLSGFYGLCVDSSGLPISDVDVRQLGFDDIITKTDEEGKLHFSRESIRQITPLQIKQLGEEALPLNEREWYRNRMVPQNIILVGIDPESQCGGWFKYNWEKEFHLELKPTIPIEGKVVNPDGDPILSTVRLYAFPNRISWNTYVASFKNQNLLFYGQQQTSANGVFSFDAIPDFSYVLEITADGYGKVQKKVISSKYDPRIINMTKEGNDYIVTRVATPIGKPKVEKIDDIVWVLKENKSLDFGLIELLVPNQTLSGIVVDRMGNPLEGYHIFVTGNGQTRQEQDVVTDSSGHFVVLKLCDGEVDVYADNGEYTVQQRDVKVGRDDLRLVSVEQSVSQTTPKIQTNDSLCDFEIILVNENTQEQIQYDRAVVKVIPESGDRFQVKLDDEGRYRIRTIPGNYTVEVDPYPLYHYKHDVKVEIKAGSENTISIPLKKYPILEGIIHFPESVSIDEIGFYVHPDSLLSTSDLKIAGDGQFCIKIQFDSWKGEFAKYGWLWIHTNDRRYVSRTKFSIKDQWLDITLQPEAVIKLKKTRRSSSFSRFTWNQTEYDNRHTQIIGNYEKMPGLHMGQLMSQFYVKDDEYFGVRGLIAGQEDLNYIFTVMNVWEQMFVPSTDLEPGQTKVIEIPTP